MSDREEILQAICAALEAAYSNAGKVIVWASDPVRVDLPYVTVKVANHDIKGDVVSDWTVHGDNAGTPTKAARGPRTALVELAAYGIDAVGWLESFPDHVQENPAVLAVLEPANVVITGFGSPVDLSALLDTDTEARAIRTLTIAYERLGEAFDIVEFNYGELDETFESHEGPGSVTLAAVLDPDNPPC